MSSQRIEPDPLGSSGQAKLLISRVLSSIGGSYAETEDPTLRLNEISIRIDFFMVTLSRCQKRSGSSELGTGLLDENQKVAEGC